MRHPYHRVSYTKAVAFLGGLESFTGVGGRGGSTEQEGRGRESKKARRNPRKSYTGGPREFDKGCGVLGSSTKL